MKALLVLVLLSFALPLQAQDTTVVTSKMFYRDTLTATIDTIDVAFRNDEFGFNRIVLTLKTTTGADTVDVYTLSLDGAFWSKISVKDLSDNTDKTQAIASTTAKEFLLIDPGPVKIRLITDDTSASCIFIVGGKKIP